MAKKMNITETEWPIMQVLWDRRTATSSEIIDNVTRNHDITLRTVKVLINRLMAKGAIAFTRDERDSRVYHYRALVPQNNVVKEKNRSFLSMVYDNNPMKLLTRFVKDSKLTAEDIAELQALLAEKKKER